METLTGAKCSPGTHRCGRAHFWDITAISALDKVVLRFRREGTEVEVVGLDAASATLVDRFALHDKPGAVEQLMHWRRTSMNKVYACIDGLDTTTAVIDWAAWSALRLEVPLELLHVLERAPEMPHVGDYSGAIGLGAQEVLLQQLSALDEQRGKMAQEAGRQMLASALRARRCRGCSNSTAACAMASWSTRCWSSNPTRGCLCWARITAPAHPRASTSITMWSV